MKLRIGLLVLAAVLPECGTTRSKPQASQCMRMKPRQDTAVQELAKFALDEAGDFPIPFPLFGEEGFDVAMALLPIASQFLVSRLLPANPLNHTYKGRNQDAVHPSWRERFDFPQRAS